METGVNFKQNQLINPATQGQGPGTAGQEEKPGCSEATG